MTLLDLVIGQLALVDSSKLTPDAQGLETRLEVMGYKVL